MEGKNKLKNIKSKNILLKIFDYLKDEKYKLKIFKYSKSFQKKIDIKIVNYQVIYIKKFNSYLKRHSPSGNDINKKYEEFLKKKKINKNEFEKILENVLKYQKEKEKEKKEMNDNDKIMKFEDYEEEEEYNKEYIDISHPFFNIYLKLNLLDKYYINIRFEEKEEKEKSINKYNPIFTKLNQLKFNYPSIKISSKDLNLTKFFKELNIDPNKIKDLGLDNDRFSDDKNENCLNLLKSLFSFKQFENNLIYLELNLGNDEENPINSNLFNSINNFNSLETLELHSTNLNELFSLKLKNLKTLSISYCSNIYISQDCCNNIKKLSLTEWTITDQPESLLKFPNLESIELEYMDDFRSFDEEDDENINYNEIIDLPKSKKLKYFKGKLIDFIFVDDKVPLLYLNLDLTPHFDEKKKKKAYKKILKINTLKKIYFYMDEIDNDILEEIHIYNNSVTDIELMSNELESECLLNSLLNKFPNLSNVYFNLCSDKTFEKANIKIQENKNCKISKISLCIDYYKSLVQFYCTNYENIIEIDFNFNCYVSYLKHAFPIFNENCKVTFKSLIKFHFSTSNDNIYDEFFHDENQKNINVKLYVLKNIYKNIDCMPNLKDFSLDCINNEVDEKLYKSFIAKLLSLDLKYLYFVIKKEYEIKEEIYSEKELREINPNIDYNIYDTIYIKKYNSKNFDKSHKKRSIFKEFN